MFTKRILQEASVVGIVFMVLGFIVAIITLRLYKYLDLKIDLPQICQSYNKYRIMEVTLFLTGFLGHIAFEATGANAYYADYKYKELHPTHL